MKFEDLQNLMNITMAIAFVAIITALTAIILHMSIHVLFR